MSEPSTAESADLARLSPALREHLIHVAGDCGTSCPSCRDLASVRLVTQAAGNGRSRRRYYAITMRGYDVLGEAKKLAKAEADPDG